MHLQYLEKFTKIIKKIKIFVEQIAVAAQAVQLVDLIKKKLNKVQITDILRHENINTTNDYYIKVDEQELKKSINKIDFLKDVV